MSIPTHEQCDCGEYCQEPCLSDQQYHDCSVAERIFKQLSPEICQKMYDKQQFNLNVNYQLHDYGAVTVTLEIKPKQDLLQQDEIKVRTLIRDNEPITDSEE